MIFGTLVNVIDEKNEKVRKLALVDYFQTREDAEKAGFKLEPYDNTKPVKSWVFRGAVTPNEDGEVSFNGIGLAKDRRTPLVKDGKPFMKAFKVPFDELEKLNIPPKTLGKYQDPTLLGEFQLPLGELQEGEFFDWVGFGLPCVRFLKAAVVPAPTSPVAGNFDAKLDEILAKLDLIGSFLFKG
jgi:hypothetical protein